MTGVPAGPAILAEALPIAVNTFVWHSPVDDLLLEPTLRKLADWGYDGVEIALEALGDWDPGRTGDLLQELGLRAVVGGVFGPGRELAAADRATIATTQDYVRGAIEVAAAIGAPMVIGPMYTSVGRTWRMSASERTAALAQLQESYRPLVDHAGERGIVLAIEPLNRYETSLLTTAAQVMELIDPLPAEVVGVNLDTYHMNIEEKTFRGAFATVGSRLRHLQVCGNDRGAPGEDHLDWAGIRTCLQEMGYRGMLGFESFTADNATIAVAASIWRSFAPTQDELARRALAYLQDWRSGFELSGAGAR